MQKLQKVAQHIAQYIAGYAIAGFLLIAAVTFGVRSGASLSQEALESIVVELSLWKVLGLIARETMCAGVLLLAVMHPFGCALCALLIAGKSFAVGYSWGWWMAKFSWGGLLPFLVTMLPQGLLSLGGYAWGSCTVSYAALRIQRLSSREMGKLLLVLWIVQCIAVLLRCIGCALVS